VAKKEKPVVRNNHLEISGAESQPGTAVQVGSLTWWAWLENPQHTGFIFEGKIGHFSARRELRRGHWYWYAYRRREGKLTKIYLGKSEDLTIKNLAEASERLAGHVSLSKLLRHQHAADTPNLPGAQNTQAIPYTGSTGGFPSIPFAKVLIPILPQSLIARPRLSSRINAPVTLICAPAGYGKTTLLNEWRLSSGLPVAWISLDEADNDALRFWSAVVTALQTVSSKIGQTLLAKIRTSSGTTLSEIVIELTNDIIRLSRETPVNQELAIILDNFQHIHNLEIITSLLFLMDQLPTNLRLVLLSQRKLPLNVSHLRAKGRLVELGGNDLRFSLEEGIEYIWQHSLDKHMAYRDMEQLVNRSNGWITGLVLAVNALSQQGSSSQFAASFTGSHPFLQDYFLSNVLDSQSPAVRDFIYNSSVLRQLSGPLCTAVTGDSGGMDILKGLWVEDLFIERVESEHFPELDWYRLHDFFKEMLLTKLHKEQPEKVPELYEKAANWFLSNNAPADAIYYLLISEKWTDAARMIEKVALRELRKFGGGSRVLRWLQQLPEAVYLDHSKLLGLYVRLNSLILDRSGADEILKRVESRIVFGEGKAEPEAIRETKREIIKIRKIWKSDYKFVYGQQRVGEHESSCQILDGIQKYQKILRKDIVESEVLAGAVYEAAREQKHLFGILMAGGTCANLALSQGHLRRSEKIAHQVLEQAYDIRGSLPESASIALTALSRIFYERNQLVQAHQLLVRATELDPKPAGMNQMVLTALLRAKIQSAQGEYDAAITTIQAVLDVLAHRPSNLWLEQDLISYQALFLLRQGNLPAAERRINEGGDIEGQPFSLLSRAAILIEQQRYVAAEEMISGLLKQHPAGYYWLPTIRARVMLATALFDQNKINQARGVMAEAAAFAGPEFFVRPFFVSGTEIVSLLSLVLHTENLNSGVRSFLKGTLTALGHPDGAQEILPRNAAKALTVSASITAREQQVLRLLGANLSNREIADQCSISTSTVKTHLENIYRKLDVNNRTEAIVHARMLNIV
jgi:LuxR family maltose regulon positive regulatory protein